MSCCIFRGVGSPFLYEALQLTFSWGEVNCSERFVLVTPHSHVSIPPKSKGHDDQRQINETGKFTRENKAFWTILGGGVRAQACHAAVYKDFAFGRLGALIGAGETWRFDWPAHMLAYDVSTRIDRKSACEERSNTLDLPSLLLNRIDKRLINAHIIGLHVNRVRLTQFVRM